MNNTMKEFAKLLREAQAHQKETKLLENFSKVLKDTKEKKQEDHIEEDITVDNSSTQIKFEDISPIEKVAKSLEKQKINENIEIERWNDPLRRNSNEKFVTFKELNDHYTNFLSRIQQQLGSIGGGGEVNFRYLDDVDRSTMTSLNNNNLLEYNASTGKVQFTNQLGPLDRLIFDLNHEHDEIRIPGTLCWSTDDKTLNLEHPSGVTQQIGQELYVKVRNRTGFTIPNGTAVRFDGAEENGTARLLVAPFLGDGTYPSLYGLGITTQTIENNTDGFVTVWGKIRDIDTSAWNVGDILYVSPNTDGKLTNIKPTAPNNVIPIAAVLRVNSINGEIFVRPTIQQQQYYGRFARTTTQTANTINTGYPVEFNDTEISNGVIIGSPASRIVVSESGFYQFDISIQAEATSNKGIVYLWFRKGNTDGVVDIPKSSRSHTVTNGDSFNISYSIQISLNSDEYIEVMWATSITGIRLSAIDTPIVGPSVASVLLSAAQIQL
jgi:hypothetical protein